jgi:hypothetical protein
MPFLCGSAMGMCSRLKALCLGSTVVTLIVTLGCYTWLLHLYLACPMCRYFNAKTVGLDFEVRVAGVHLCCCLPCRFKQHAKCTFKMPYTASTQRAAPCPGRSAVVVCLSLCIGIQHACHNLSCMYLTQSMIRSPPLHDLQEPHTAPTWFWLCSARMKRVKLRFWHHMPYRRVTGHDGGY